MCTQRDLFQMAGALSVTRPELETGCKNNTKNKLNTVVMVLNVFLNL